MYRILCAQNQASFVDFSKLVYSCIFARGAVYDRADGQSIPAQQLPRNTQSVVTAF